MSLSQELIAKFVKVTNDSTKPQTETTLYGTIVEYAGEKYVKIDGSDHSTPLASMESTTDIVGIKPNDRVTVMIKNHTATITGNLTAPSVNSNTLNDAAGGAADKIAQFEILLADKVGTDAFTAALGRINTLETNNLEVNNELLAQKATINDLKSFNVTVSNTFTAHKALIDKLSADKIDASVVAANYATIEKLEALQGSFHTLDTTYASFSQATAERLNAAEATIRGLNANYANIDFANIGEAAIKKFYSTSGIIKNLTVADGTYTGELAGVKISGDLITANTVVADKLVIKGTNGLYYKLNTDGMKTETEQTSQNSLDGSVILAKSITATKISVTDLVAFGATIGGFVITDDAIHSSAKPSATNATRGIYLDNSGQMSVGDATNYVKYYKDGEVYKLAISANDISLSGASLTATINDLKSVEVGGRNLLCNSSETVENAEYILAQISFADPNAIKAGETYTVSFDGMLSDPVQKGFYINVFPTPYKGCCSINAISKDGTYNRYKATFTMPDNGSFTKIGIYSSEVGNYKLAGVKNVKLERGDKATDWTPAPEDVDSSISSASKSATDFMSLGTEGLVIGNLLGSTLGKNVLIATDSVRIRTGTTENAIFGADLIELAKNNASATISMLNGRFKIYYSSDIFEPGLGVYGVTTDGTARLAFQPLNENNNLTLGWGGYNAKANCTNIYGHNINLIAGNDMAFECEDWKINIDGNLSAKASTDSFIELIGLSSDDNTAIGHGGYSAAIGKTNIYGNKIQHIVNTESGPASYKPYYEAGDSFETEWYGAGFISSSSKVVYFSIPLSKPIIGSTTPNVTVANATTGKGGLQIRQDSNYVFGSSSTEKATPSSYSAKVVGNGNFVQIEATMANTTNAINNAPCGINAFIKITFS